MYNINSINNFINKNYNIKGGKNNKTIQLKNKNETKTIDNFLNNTNDCQKRIYFYIYYLILTLFDNTIYENIDNYDYLDISYLDYLINNNIIYFKELYSFNF